MISHLLPPLPLPPLPLPPLSSPPLPLPCAAFPQVDVAPPTAQVKGSCQVTFYCTDHQAPPINYMWSLNGRRLTSSGHVIIKPMGILVIANTSRYDVGNYTCTVWNSAGTASSTAVLVVDVPMEPCRYCECCIGHLVPIPPSPLSPPLPSPPPSPPPPPPPLSPSLHHISHTFLPADPRDWYSTVCLRCHGRPTPLPRVDVQWWSDP